MKHYEPYNSDEFLAHAALNAHIRSGAEPVKSMCTWHDVCGFGGILDKHKWDLSTLSGTDDVTVLSDVYDIAGDPGIIGIPPGLCEKVLILNDGIAKSTDILKPHDDDWGRVCFYLRDAPMKHFMMQRLLKKRGLAVRTVMAGGERLQYTIPKKTGASYLYYTDEPSEYGKQLLQAEFVYNPTEFQMNTAFAKAYSIEAQGSKSGIKTGHLYIEDSYFELLNALLPGMVERKDEEIIIHRDSVPVLIYEICDKLQCQVKGISLTVHNIKGFTVCDRLEGETTRFDLLQYI